MQLGRHAEAEEPLLQAYGAFRPGGAVASDAMTRKSLKRLIALYEGWNKPAQVAEYRSLLGKRE